MVGRSFLNLQSRFGVTDEQAMRRVKMDDAILTIRAKKSDIDDFAKDKLKLDQFRRKAIILLYYTAFSQSAVSAVTAMPLAYILLCLN